ncbi:MAG: ABC transporter ATP-binding protein [Flavobacteriaceae bacterium]
MNTLLELHNLSKTYGKIRAVDQLSIRIEKGHVYGLLGPNGSGKSTTLGMVLNVINPTGGHFQWFGGSLTVHQTLKRIGAIIERPNFYPYMTAMQNLKLVCTIKQCPYEKVEEKLKLVELWDRRDSKFSTYSLGMKQRLAIASALVSDPELLILDEPTNGLDPKGIHQIRELIAKIAAQGTTVLLASHLLDEVEKVCSHVIVLKNGVKYYEGPVDQLTHSHGYFELQAPQMSALQTALEKLALFDTLKTQNGKILAYPKKPLAPESLNQKLAAQKIFLSTLNYKKKTLEEQFLELTNRPQQP